MKKVRQPIVTVAGHVDHGKTSILDQIRGTSIQEGEAGGITQKISFTSLTKDDILKRAGKTFESFKIPLEIPGLLFIDTPGHAAFTNLRKRGGNLADIAVLVVDINDGIKPQTAEVLKILKLNKTPFIIALNKVDNISGWKTSESGRIVDSLDSQAVAVKQNFEEKFYTIVGALNSHQIDSDLYFKIEDFTKNVAIVPCSAKTGEGISEIIAVLSALSQKFLKNRITMKEEAKGVILEVKKEKSANYIESILYDGKLKKNDEIIVSSFDEPVVTRIRSLEKSLPLNKGYESVGEIEAASGMRMQITSKDEILPGMQFKIIDNNVEELKKEFIQELSEEVKTDKKGIIAKADSLGSLEALLVLLRQKQIEVIQIGIGPITKKDVYVANSLPDEDRIILGFNVELADSVSSDETKKIEIITDDVVYKMIENFEKWREEKEKEIERKKLGELPTIAKITVLDFVFRNTSPAIFGVSVDGGKIIHGEDFINSNDEKIGKIKAIQEEKTSLKEAEMGKEVAISMPGVNFERQLKVGENLYTNLGESQFRKFKKYKDLLTSDEKSVLQEITTIKRKASVTWGA